MTDIATIMRTSPVIPVLVIDDAGEAMDLAEALVAGGLHVLEVTLRTPAAIEAIREMKRVPGAIVGAGTVVSEAQFREAQAAGAEFIVSPGLTERLAGAIARLEFPTSPASPPPAISCAGSTSGWITSNSFPPRRAAASPALTALAAPFSQCRFCPTGGITEASAADWLALLSVLCVGGSWVARGTAAQITERAASASMLSRRSAKATTPAGSRGGAAAMPRQRKLTSPCRYFPRLRR